MKSYDKNKESSYRQYRDINHLYDWAKYRKRFQQIILVGKRYFSI